MVEETNADQSQASSNDKKRQRLHSIVEDEVITTKLPRHLLECPICFNALTIPTFQCDNGHITCSACWTKLRNKCPICKVHLGKIRCRFAESVVKASFVPCPNAIHGCTQKFSYGKELAHEEKCSFVLCYCPAPNCNYTGMYKGLYSHYSVNHRCICDYFNSGVSRSAVLYNGMKNKVYQEYKGGPLVVVQCFEVQKGMHVTVNCIAPCAPGVGKFSYQFSYSSGHHRVEFGPVEMNRIRKVSLQTPKKGSCMFCRRLVEEEAEGVEEAEEVINTVEVEL